MMRNLILFLAFLYTSIGFSQELRATVAINYDQVNNGNPQLFKREKQRHQSCSKTIREKICEIRGKLSTLIFIHKHSLIFIFQKNNLILHRK